MIKLINFTAKINLNNTILNSFKQTTKITKIKTSATDLKVLTIIVV